MPKGPQENERSPMQEELIRALEDVRRQIALIDAPPMMMPRNRTLLARLKAMAKEIGECLEAMESEDA